MNMNALPLDGSHAGRSGGRAARGRRRRRLPVHAGVVLRHGADSGGGRGVHGARLRSAAGEQAVRCSFHRGTFHRASFHRAPLNVTQDEAGGWGWVGHFGVSRLAVCGEEGCVTLKGVAVSRRRGR